MTSESMDRELQSLSARLQARELEQDMLLGIGNKIAAARQRSDLLNVITEDVLALLSGKYYTLCLINPDGQTHSPFLHTGQPELKTDIDDDPVIHASHPIADGIFDAALAADEPLIFDLAAMLKAGPAPDYIARWHKLGIREMVVVRIVNGDEARGLLYIYADAIGAFRHLWPPLLLGLAAQIGTGICNVLANERIVQQMQEIERYKQRLEDENRYLQEQHRLTDKSTGILGESPAMQQVFRLVNQVAASDSTVLLLGETGTGKELVAKAIHDGSGRREKLMIRVNCAALPANLIESELFGHERGSFTGANERRIGKFELAHNSTLFLDEIGELPPELQVRLLRVLQVKEFERVGGHNTVKVNVRIIAATNRDLQQEVAAGRFRADLYYRLNVFPILLPPLRDRKSDILDLALHFAARYARNNGRRITGFSAKAMEGMRAYSWPGNVRELEHLIERAVLLASGTVITDVQLPDPSSKKNRIATAFELRPLEDVERDYILQALRQFNGRVSGPSGVAIRLGLPATTLLSRMKKLGIRKEHFVSGDDTQD